MRPLSTAFRYSSGLFLCYRTLKTNLDSSSRRRYAIIDYTSLTSASSKSVWHMARCLSIGKGFCSNLFIGSLFFHLRLPSGGFAYGTALKTLKFGTPRIYVYEYPSTTPSFSSILVSARPLVPKTSSSKFLNLTILSIVESRHSSPTTARIKSQAIIYVNVHQKPYW